MYAGGWVTVSSLEALAPDPIRAQLDEVYGFLRAFPAIFTLVAIGLAVTAEDIIFRGALLMPLLAMNRPALAIAVSTMAFTLAHLLIGPPILVLGAFLAGGCWAWLAARTRSFVAPMLAHLLWDLTVLWVAPY
jgi:membrane protease YdiL (CAAX protease family)